MVRIRFNFIFSMYYTILIDYKKYKNGYSELNNLLLQYNIDLQVKQIPVVFIAIILMQPNKTLCLAPFKEYFKERTVEDNTNGYYQLTKAFLSKSLEKLSLFNSL
jgi:hypothetical protein